MADLDTLNKRVRAIEKINIETLDLGPVKDGKLLYQDKVNFINRTLRSTANRLNKRKDAYLAFKRSESVTQSIDKVSDGNPDAFARLVKQYPEVLEKLITNEEIALSFAKLLERLNEAGVNNETQNVILAKTFEKVGSSHNQKSTETVNKSQD